MSNVTFLDMLAEQIVSRISAGNAISAKIAAQDEGAKNKAIFELIKTSDDPKAISFREKEEAVLAKLEQLRAELTEHLRGQLPEAKPLTEEEIAALKERHNTLRSEVKASLQFARMQPDYTNEWAESLPKMATFKGRPAASGNATGVKRPRLASVSIDGTEFRPTDKDGNPLRVTFSLVSLELAKREKAKGNGDVKILPSEILAALESTSANWADGAGTEFMFRGYTLVATPRDK